MLRRMGKAKRLKAERRQAAHGRRDLGQSDLARLLEIATEAVGDAFGEQADCAAAAGVLARVGELLGATLTPRPVSLLATDSTTGDVAFMGPKATAMIPSEARAKVEDMRPDGKDNGHLVLTLAEPPLMFDPNLRQLGAWGMEAPSLALRIGSVQPDSQQWGTRVGALSLLYLLDEENDVLLERFEDVKAKSTANAEALVDMLRMGYDADDIRRQMTPARLT